MGFRYIDNIYRCLFLKRLEILEEIMGIRYRYVSTLLNYPSDLVCIRDGILRLYQPQILQSKIYHIFCMKFDPSQIGLKVDSSVIWFGP